MDPGTTRLDVTARDGQARNGREPDVTEPEGLPALAKRSLVGRARAFLAQHHRKLWWLHSLYAMCLGAFVVVFAQKGFFYARWLTLMLLVGWFIIILVFRIAGSGRAQHFETPKDKLRFLVMTYVLKNLYQGMLFFLLPFYWKTATLDASNRWFVLFLALSALLATLDLVFDRVLMRWRLMASIYYGATLFAALNLAIPAIYPTPAVVSLLVAAFAASISFWTLHFPLRALAERPRFVAMVLSGLLAVGGAYAARRHVPPVPLQVAGAAVGPEMLPDGRLAYEVSRMHVSRVEQISAVVDVFTPAGVGEDFLHVWRHDDAVIAEIRPTVQKLQGTPGTIRLRSALRSERLPADRSGRWSVDVETAHGQLVGRYAFEVTE